MATKRRGRPKAVPPKRETVADRLRIAIDKQPPERLKVGGRPRRGLRLFQAKMQKRSEELWDERREVLVGCHLSSIQGYLATARPPERFLEEAALVLKVRHAWLTTGEEPMSELPLSSVGRAFGVASPEELDRANRIGRAFQEGAGPGAFEQFGTLPLHDGGTALPLLLNLWRQRLIVRQGIPGRAAPTPEDEDQLARQIGRAIIAPLEALGVKWRTTEGYLFMHEHIEAMTPVLYRALILDDPPVTSIASYIGARDPVGDKSEG